MVYSISRENIERSRDRGNGFSTPMEGSSSNVFTRGEGREGERRLRDEICHPVHETIRVVHGPRLYHHCHPSWKIKLISHMSARFVPIHLYSRLTVDSIAWHNMKLWLFRWMTVSREDTIVIPRAQINTTFVACCENEFARILVRLKLFLPPRFPLSSPIRGDLHDFLEFEFSFFSGNG